MIPLEREIATLELALFFVNSCALVPFDDGSSWLSGLSSGIARVRGETRFS